MLVWVKPSEVLCDFDLFIVVQTEGEIVVSSHVKRMSGSGARLPRLMPISFTSSRFSRISLASPTVATFFNGSASLTQVQLNNTVIIVIVFGG